jgi:hypothetical protein
VGRLIAALGRRFDFSGDARSWSRLALAAGVVAAFCDGLVIAAQEDKSSLLWPVILLPVVLVPLPVVLPGRAVRIGAALAMTVWCWLTGFSLGPLFTPCLLLMIVAAVKEDA